MSERVYLSMVVQIKSLTMLFIYVAWTMLLTSCGGLVGQPTPPGWKSQVPQVPPVFPGEERNVNELPASIESSDHTSYKGKTVVTSQILVYPKKTFDGQLESFLRDKNWMIMAKSRVAWQVNVGAADLDAAINEVDTSGFGSASYNIVMSH